MSIPAKPPAADRKWHATARRWYSSLAVSGQAAYYQASDWATAYLIAEAISRELKPQQVIVGEGDNAVVFEIERPPRGASIAAWLKGMTALMVTEGDRRRLQLELELPPSAEGAGASVTAIDDARRRLNGGAS